MRALQLVFLILAAIQLIAQEEHLKPVLIDNTDPTRWIYISPKQAPGIRGDHYLFEEWRTAEIIFREGVSKEGMLVNYNLEDDELEIYTTDGIKIVPKGFIKSWSVRNEDKKLLFQASRGLDLGCLDQSKSYSEILLQDSTVCLLKIYEIERKNPSYNEKLGIGDNNFKIIKSDHVYLVKDQQCVRLPKSSPKREKILIEFLQDRRVEQIIEKQKLKIKDDDDLISLLQMLNTLN